MTVYAVVKDGIVQNSIEADARVIAEAVLGQLDGDIVEQTDATGIAFIGSGYENGKFMAPRPYDSWIFDKSSWSWVAPLPYPLFPEGKRGVWNEGNQNWEEVDLPPMMTPSQA